MHYFLSLFVMLVIIYTALFFLIREINIVHTYSFLLLCVSIDELLAMSALAKSEDLKAFDAPTREY